MTSRHRRWLLCGGIGSGKSEVRQLLTDARIRTVDADEVGHQVLAGEAFRPVSERWPEVVFEGEIRRETLARIVFEDPGELAALEAITHPMIFGRIHAELEGFPGVAVVEMPLIDSGLGWPIIVVDAADDVRIQRAVDRGMSQADVKRRMATQPSRTRWLAVADVVVPNHGSREDLRDSVVQLAGFLDPSGRLSRRPA